MKVGRPAGISLLLFVSAVALVVVTSGLTVFTDTAFASLLTKDGGPYLAVLVAALLLVALYYLSGYVAKTATRFIGVDVETRDASRQRPASYLIMGYSAVTDREELKRMEDELTDLDGETIALDTESYEKYFDKTRGEMPQQNKWQQNIRACWPHGASLRRVLVLENDRNQFEEFSGYLKRAISNRCPNASIEFISDPIDPSRKFGLPGPRGVLRKPDYAEYEYVDAGIRRALRMIGAEVKPEGEVVIDVTPGLKTFSIAAAVITFNEDIVFSYVGSDGIPVFYDAALKLDSPPILG